MASIPEWIEELANGVASYMTPVDFLAPIGCHFCCVDGQWEITLFAAATEVVGGRKDGVKRPSNFTMDLARVFELFNEVTTFHWQALSLGTDDDLGAHVSLEGICQGQPVWLRVLSRAPRRFEPGRQARIYDQRWNEVW
jgi:hypothetical protein